MPLRNRLVTLIEGLAVELDCDVQEDTSLIKSGLFDSLALLELAEWIEGEIDAPVDLTAFDLSTEWDTIPAILHFIAKCRGSR
jgi:acyl carrier protein